ncbi:hypothetical protein SSX86_003305 [Deinandra increscens subsp. villosa]|uniref:Reverse transcriptase domain-containing protein n=1 Tax=Deinandra increscens subsp. villosa TaxID=3103831 RepID=A0AAP0H7N0_9ASTR
MILYDENITYTTIHYLGGLYLLMKFSSSGDAKDFLANKRPCWTNIFKNLQLWEDHPLNTGRIVQLSITGVPFHLRCRDTFESIGSAYGMIIDCTDFEWDAFDISIGFCYILTNNVKRIEGKFVLCWNNLKYYVWVCENTKQWIPTIFEIPSTSTSISSEDDLEMNSLDSLYDDIEEGEWRASEENSPSKTISGFNIATPTPPENFPTADTISGYERTAKEGFTNFLTDPGEKADRNLLIKLKAIKTALKSWSQRNRSQQLVEEKILKDTIDGLELKAEVLGLLAKNRINAVLQNGKWVHDPFNIKRLAAEFFKEKIKEPLQDRLPFHSNDFKRISRSQASELIKDFSAEELKEVVWNCAPSKAPGLDGFNIKFFKHHSDLMGPALLEVMQQFHSYDQSSPGCNSSFITLTPKVSDPIDYGQFRPVILIGSIYKIIAKVIYSRIKKVMNSIISDTQSAYLEGRSILDNPLILNESIAWLKRNKKYSLLFKVDFEKAFDTINWNFLDSTMEQMGFPTKWRQWIRGCLASSRLSILINGSPTEEFQVHRGVKQGDPLSPLLFIIRMEVLHLASQKSVNEWLFRGI